MAESRRLAFTEEELATLLASEYQRGYSTGLVIARSGAQLEVEEAVATAFAFETPLQERYPNG